MKKFGTYFISILIPLAVGGLAGRLSRDGMAAYESLAKPPLSPPGWVFPAAWVVLYILMGISAAVIWLSEDEKKQDALFVYAVSLFINFFWPIFFFSYGACRIAFFWLLLLLAFGIVMVRRFGKISKAAGRLNIPYLLWLIFAAYLNLGVCLLN